ncbi:MAG: Proline--tRNA ligase [bacterium ADurb.Bin400]|nr:MAG: Proline--tRNA ligase [bacterium ADurb.Bin400]
MDNQKVDKKELGITPRSADYSKWYLDVIREADLAEHAPVKGCMIIKPYGYAIWENIQSAMDKMIKETGVSNAYFPLFIPQSYLTKEAEHVEGFAPECAVVTHAGGKKLEEPFVVRPTSETIMYEVFSRWIQSYRDLPLLINQWANVVRWELRPRLFLRTTEFLWQEGHTAHATEDEAETRTKQMLGVYKKLAEDFLAIPVIDGVKSESEKFAGAVRTYAIEAMMQDGKALQAGTSHMLGQNFAKAFNVKFVDENGAEQYAWQTSWGVSTRLIGALIMAHSDDKGLVLPPNIAPIQVVIVPVWVTNEDKMKVLAESEKMEKQLKDLGLSVKIDSRDLRPGPRFFEWEKKGVPIRIEIGPKDIEKGAYVFARRDTGEKENISIDQAANYTSSLLNIIQNNLFERSLAFRNSHTREVGSYDELKEAITGGFAIAHWCGDAKCEEKIKEETKATIRVLLPEKALKPNKCVLCGGKSDQRAVFAKNY